MTRTASTTARHDGEWLRKRHARTGRELSLDVDLRPRSEIRPPAGHQSQSLLWRLHHGLGAIDLSVAPGEVNGDSGERRSLPPGVTTDSASAPSARRSCSTTR